MSEHCPTCGSLVEVVSSDEGTSHFRPSGVSLDVERLARALMRAEFRAVYTMAYGDPVDTARTLADLYTRLAQTQEGSE